MNNTLRKVIKGTLAIFVLNLVFFLGMLIFQSCQAESIETKAQQIEKTTFLVSLRQSQKDLNTIPFNTKDSKRDGFMSREIQEATETICLQFSEEILNEYGEIDLQEALDQVETVTELIQVKQQYGLQINPEYLDVGEGEGDNDSSDETDETEQECLATFEVPIQPVLDALNLTVIDAKSYLNAKGLSNQDINNMIVEENGTELDLIPLVMAMVDIENSNTTTAINYFSLFGASAYVQSVSLSDVGRCTAMTIGADVLWALGGSSASAWALPTITKAFGAVTKRLLGPIGVAIAVVTFGVCITEAALSEE